MNEHIENALEQFRNQSARYRRSNRYYAGRHDLSFATEKFANTFGDLFREFALNLCPAVVDAVRDKLRIRGFGIQRIGERSPEPTAEAAADIRAAIDRFWRVNRMAIRAGEVHKEALKNGDAYLIVWPGDGGIRMFPNSAESCTVHYNENEPGRIDWAAKYWRDGDRRTRLNLFFADRIEKYRSTRKSDGLLPEAKDLVPMASGADADGGGEALENPFGIVPVFHFANNADIGSFGRSELEPVMPIQDGLNKSVLDMLVAMEVCAFRQRWAAGIEIQIDEATGKEVSPFNAGVDRLWVASNADARFGDLGAADLEQFLKVKDGFRLDIASVTGTPLHYLMPQMRGFPSGESLRKAEARFIAKVRDRQELFGSVWADAVAFALRASGWGEVAVTADWEDPAPISEREALENLKLKRELGISAEQVMREAGYGDVDIREMRKGERK